MCYENSHTVCGRIYSILQFNKSRKTVGIVNRTLLINKLRLLHKIIKTSTAILGPGRGKENVELRILSKTWKTILKINCFHLKTGTLSYTDTFSQDVRRIFRRFRSALRGQYTKKDELNCMQNTKVELQAEEGFVCDTAAILKARNIETPCSSLGNISSLSKLQINLQEINEENITQCLCLL